MFDASISDHKQTDIINVQKIVIDRRWVDRIGENEKNISDPVFNHLKDVKTTGMIKDGKMVFPIIAEGKSVGCVQLQQKPKRG